MYIFIVYFFTEELCCLFGLGKQKIEDMCIYMYLLGEQFVSIPVYL